MNFLYSPIEQFEVNSLVHLQAPILDYTTIALTNIGLYTIISVVLIIGLHFVSNNNNRLVPSRWGLIVESLYSTVLGILRSQISSQQEHYLPLLYSIFIFILVANLISNVTYGFAVTTSIVVSIGLSFTVFIAVTIIGINIHGIKFVNFFVPSGVPNILLILLVPIEVVSYLSRSVSLGVRLLANICAGHALLTILAGFIVSGFTSGLFGSILTIIPFALFIAIVVLEIAVAFIQAYVFTVLTASYINDVIYIH